MSVIICIVAIVVYLVIGAVIAGLVDNFEPPGFIYGLWPLVLVCLVFVWLFELLDEITLTVSEWKRQVFGYTEED